MASPTEKNAAFYAPDPSAAYMGQAAYGRMALHKQIQDAKATGKPNPWVGIVERLTDKSRETFERFSSLLHNQGWSYDFQKHQFVHSEWDIEEDEERVYKKNDDLIKNQQSKIYDDVREQAFFKEILHGKPCSFQTAMPIVELLKTKSKYPKDHPRYTNDDEYRVLTSRLSTFLKKVEAGALLSEEDKRKKHAKTS